VIIGLKCILKSGKMKRQDAALRLFFTIAWKIRAAKQGFRTCATVLASVWRGLSSPVLIASPTRRKASARHIGKSGRKLISQDRPKDLRVASC